MIQNCGKKKQFLIIFTFYNKIKLNQEANQNISKIAIIYQRWTHEPSKIERGAICNSK